MPKPTKERPIKTSKRVQCFQCLKTFKHKTSLQAHVRNVHGDPNYECDKCNYKTTAAHHLRRHSRTHKKIRTIRFVCTICKKGFFQKCELKLHLITHEKYRNRKQMPCYFCEKVYLSREGLYLHLQLHTKEKLVGPPADKTCKCKQCSEVYDNWNELIKHIRRVHGIERKYKCRICSFRFQTKGALKVHKASVHFNIRPFQCSTCSNTFKHLGHLKTHVQNVHFRVRDYSCEKCPKMFSTVGLLKNHVQSMHSLIKPFPCTICSSRYASKQNLKGHIKEKHQPKGYPCYFCSREFARSHKYQQHLYTHTKERRLKCTFKVEGKPCPFTFYNPLSLQCHTRVKHEGYRIQCTLCSHKATSRSSLFTHITRIHTREMTNKCGKCGRRFYSRTELRNHACRPIDNLLNRPTKRPTFPCLICRSTRVTFTTEQNLRIHMEGYHPEKSFCCYFCSKLFNMQGSFEGHIRREHTKEKVMKCHICYARFFTVPLLFQHKLKYKHYRKGAGNLQ